MNIKLPMKPILDHGSGNPLILLQGATDNLFHWKDVIERYSSTHRVLVPRLPLYSVPVSPKRFDDLVEYLHCFMEERALEKAVLRGNILGEQVAVLYLMKYPARVDKVILTCGSGYYLSPADWIPGNIRMFER